MKFDFLVGPIRTVIRFDRFDSFSKSWYPRNKFLLNSEFLKFDFLVGSTCIVIENDRFDVFQFLNQWHAVADNFLPDFIFSSDGTHGYAIPHHSEISVSPLDQVPGAFTVCALLMSAADIAAMQLCQSRNDRDEQARRDFNTAIFLATTADIVAMKVYQSQKDRDEQAQSRFKMFSMLYILCGRMRLLTDMQLFTILYTQGGRRRLPLAIQFFTILYTSCGFNIVIYTADIVATKVYQFQKDRDEQAQSRFELCSVLYTLCGRRKLITAIQFFTILYTSCGRRELLLPIQIFTVADIKVVAVSALIGILADTSEWMSWYCNIFHFNVKMAVVSVFIAALLGSSISCQQHCCLGARSIRMLIGLNSLYVYATAADASIIITPDRVHMKIGEVTNLEAAEHSFIVIPHHANLIMTWPYHGEFAPTTEETDGVSPRATLAKEGA